MWKTNSHGNYIRLMHHCWNEEKSTVDFEFHETFGIKLKNEISEITEELETERNAMVKGKVMRKCTAYKCVQVGITRDKGQFWSSYDVAIGLLWMMMVFCTTFMRCLPRLDGLTECFNRRAENRRERMRSDAVQLVATRKEIAFLVTLIKMLITLNSMFVMYSFEERRTGLWGKLFNENAKTRKITEMETEMDTMRERKVGIKWVLVDKCSWKGSN